MVGQLFTLEADPRDTDANCRLNGLQVSNKGGGLDFSESSDREEGMNRSMPSGFQKRQPVLINRLTPVEHLLVCKLSTFAQKRFSKFFFQELCRK